MRLDLQTNFSDEWLSKTYITIHFEYLSQSHYLNRDKLFEVRKNSRFYCRWSIIYISRRKILSIEQYPAYFYTKLKTALAWNVLLKLKSLAYMILYQIFINKLKETSLNFVVITIIKDIVHIERIGFETLLNKQIHIKRFVCSFHPESNLHNKFEICRPYRSGSIVLRIICW